jgi:ATP-dependent RNA helicase DDX52/ROK1
MDDLFHILSSSARINKTKQLDKQHNQQKGKFSECQSDGMPSNRVDEDNKMEFLDDIQDDDNDLNCNANEESLKNTCPSRDRKGKRDTSESKLEQIRREQMAAFRRTMKIQVKEMSTSSTTPDAVSKFEEIQKPSWLSSSYSSFEKNLKSILHNIEIGEWKEPTPIQMQVIPSLLERRDVLASAPTGSGKSGAFCIPALILSSIPMEEYYNPSSQLKDSNSITSKEKKSKKKISRQGEIRSLLLAPSRELAHQLHREIERLGRNQPGGMTSLLLQKSNSNQVSQVGGQKGLDVLVSTPLRLVDVLEQKGIKLDAVRLVVLDEADRLLDATDQKGLTTSGSSHTKTFVSQLDTILSMIPSTAVRALFSATITPAVQELSESILRNACHITVQSSLHAGGANTDISQELLFCGREEGKLLAIRQLVAHGKLHPPALIFCQSQERAQALFAELLYDNLHVDVLHAGRSPAAREAAVQNFRMGKTWVLICTDLVARGVDFRAVKLVINYDLPSSGVTYVHRIGRTGRAGRKGTAITFFTESDLPQLRTIANIMKQSGCDVPKWMLQLKKSHRKGDTDPPRRPNIDTTPAYDKMKRHRKAQYIEHSKRKKQKQI